MCSYVHHQSCGAQESLVRQVQQLEERIKDLEQDARKQDTLLQQHSRGLKELEPAKQISILIQERSLSGDSAGPV